MFQCCVLHIHYFIFTATPAIVYYISILLMSGDKSFEPKSPWPVSELFITMLFIISLVRNYHLFWRPKQLTFEFLYYILPSTEPCSLEGLNIHFTNKVSMRIITSHRAWERTVPPPPTPSLLVCIWHHNILTNLSTDMYWAPVIDWRASAFWLCWRC